jgi:hypothetical protein
MVAVALDKTNPTPEIVDTVEVTTRNVELTTIPLATIDDNQRTMVVPILKDVGPADFIQESEYPEIGTSYENVYIPTRPPSIRFSDSMGNARIDFKAESVIINGDNGYTFNNVFVNNVVITDNLLFEANNQQTRDIIKQNISAQVQHAIQRGDIQLVNALEEGATGFDVTIDTSATGTRDHAGLNTFYNFEFGRLTPERKAEIEIRQAAFEKEQKRQRFKQMLKSQMAPAFINHRGGKVRSISRGASFADVQGNEIVALGLLKSMIPDDVFKKYLKYGFVTVQGESGLTYQIQRKSHIIKVWSAGSTVATLCVYVSNQSIPPTDDVVTKILICQCDEADIWKRANVSWKIANGVNIADITTRLGIPLPTTRSAFDLGLNNIQINNQLQVA